MSTTAPGPSVNAVAGRRRKRARARRHPPLADRAEQSTPALLAVLVVGSVLAIGTVHTETLLVISAVALSGVALALASGRWTPVPAATLALALALYTLLQALPLPLSVLGILSPVASDTWERALSPFGETLRWGSLSIDRGASLVEALKWLTYGAVFGLAAHVGKRRGAAFVASLSFGSAALVALITLGHGLWDAKEVYGLYTPSFTPTRWSTSPLLNPNNLAGYLNLGTFAGLGLLISSRGAWPRWTLIVGTALIVGQTILSGSRGGVLTLFVGALGLALILPRIQRSGKRRASSWQVALALGGGLGLALLGAQQVTWQELQQEGTEKLAMVRWTLPMVRDHLWFGVGGGAFETAFPAYRVTGGTPWRHPENFVVAWVSEWGVLVGLGALAGLSWMFRPRRIGAAQSRLVACMLLGITVICLQNLVDLGFSLPGVFIGLAAALGGLWGAWQKEDPEPQSPRRSQARLVPGLLLGAGVTTFVSVVALGGLHSARSDRNALAALYRETDFDQPKSRDTYRSTLRQAMLRHPGDPFLPRLGALAALRTAGENPLPWVTRALERDMMSGRMHLLLAEILARRGHVHQALLELRLAAERDPELAHAFAPRAWAWSADLEDVRRAVPDDAAGVQMLLALSRTLPSRDSRPASWRRLLLDEALQRDPHHVEVHAALARDLLIEIAAGGEPCASTPAPCLARVDEHLRVLPPRQPRTVELQAERLAVEGKREAAIAYLLERCPRTHAACLRRAVELSAQTESAPLDEPSQTYLAVACRTSAACASARLWVGDLYARRQLWGPALAQYGHAARASHNPRLWLRVASAASHQGAHRQALDALGRAEHLLSSDNDPELAKQIEAERRRVIDRMAQLPGAPSQAGGR